MARRSVLGLALVLAIAVLAAACGGSRDARAGPNYRLNLISETSRSGLPGPGSRSLWQLCSGQGL
jgi:hypothetical protein